MLLVLPKPGLPEFKRLVQALRPYSISASAITYDEPTQELVDDYLELSYQDEDVFFRLSYGAFSLSAENLAVTEVDKLADVVESLFRGLNGARADPRLAEASVGWKADLILSRAEGESIILEYLSSREAEPTLIPDGVAYRLSWDEAVGIRSARLAIAKNPMLPKALQVEYTGLYTAPAEPASVVRRIVNDCGRALSQMGLNLINAR